MFQIPHDRLEDLLGMIPQRSDVHELPAPGVAAGEALELPKDRLFEMSAQSPLAPPGFPCRPSTASAHTESKGTRAVSAPGGEEVVSVNVRPVAATNRDPKEAIAEGRLRPDLHHRLRVLHIPIPRLRGRGQDVEFLARQRSRTPKRGEHRLPEVGPP